MLFGAYKYLIGEYHMIKTILTMTHTASLWTHPQHNIVMDQVAIWQAEGKYTGELEITHDTVTGVRHVNRWGWIDTDTAEAYKNLTVSNWINIYPDVNVDIVVE